MAVEFGSLIFILHRILYFVFIFINMHVYLFNLYTEIHLYLVQVIFGTKKFATY